MTYPLRNMLLPPHILPHFGQMKAVFNDEEIERIQFFKKILDFSPAETHSLSDEEKPLENYRVCEAATMSIDQNTEWLWSKISDLSAQANYDLFLYEIEYLETLQYLIYEGNGKSKYDWHSDRTIAGYRKYDRKISGILMLSDPSEYEGGKFLIDRFNEPEAVELEKGDVLFFDSTFSHCVEPVLKGQREVIVFWVHGQTKI